ncbi:MAG: response regulator [Sulfitobacter sp.]
MALRDKLHVLVVDDMSTSRGLITQALDTIGVRNYRTADNGGHALDVLRQRPAHLVISDYNMPEMDGLHLLHHLRAGERTKHIGFILITGRAEQQIIDHGKKLGMNNFLRKPFQPPDLRNCIETVVGRL